LSTSRYAGPGTVARGRGALRAARSIVGGSGAGVGVVYVLIGALLWSTGGVALKSMAIPSLTVAGSRALIAGLFLAPFLMRLRWRWDWRLVPLVGGYASTVLSFTVAIRMTSAADAIALVYTAPAWVFLMTCVAERRVPWRMTPPVILVLAGLCIILAQPATGSSVAGNLIAIGAGLGYGVFTFFVPRLRQPPIALVSLCNLCAAAILFGLFPSAIPWAGVPWPDWGLLLYAGIVQIALGHVFFMSALSRIPATQASIVALAEPLLNPVWVFLFLGEIPSAYGVAGLSVILCGVVVDLVLRRGSPSAPAVAPSAEE
jgi:drug/metabolite transporter (DMT)-like permease